MCVSDVVDLIAARYGACLCVSLPPFSLSTAQTSD